MFVKKESGKTAAGSAPKKPLAFKVPSGKSGLPKGSTPRGNMPAMTKAQPKTFTNPAGKSELYTKKVW